ncbi:MAG: nucleotidyltransferase domain-containing protein [Euryarchaeota archaeon]|nr:nucleotidyltransferase domain-containing protein [Euryarchaeota archaeon]
MIVHQLSKKKKTGVKNSLNIILAKREEVVFAYLYGSLLSANWFRDIDIAVFVDEKRVSRKEALDYEISLSLELEKELRMPVDVKLLNYAPLSFKYEVTKGEVIFSRNEEARFSFLEETWHRYLDYAPVEREFIKEML